MESTTATNHGYLEPFLTKIIKVEKNWQVSEFRNFEVLIWPMVRLSLARRWEENKRNIKSVSSPSPPGFFPRQWKQKIRACSLGRVWGRWRGRTLGRQLGWSRTRATWAALLASSKMEQTGEKGWQHKFFDPLESMVSPQHKRLALFLDDASIGSVMKNNIEGLLAKACRWGRYLEAPVSQNEAKIFNEIEDYLGLTHADLTEIKKEAGLVLALSHIFETALRGSRVAALYLTCFYQPVCFALALACRRAGIPCVEFQHGQQGDAHFMYTDWHNIPAGGYAVVPSDFWCWGKSSALRIRSWACPTAGCRVWEGGNPWLSLRSRSAQVSFSSRPWNRPIQRVLISLQFTELPSFIWDTINQAPEIEWYIRLHPRFGKETESFAAVCQRNILPGIRWDLHGPSRRDFYELLAEVDAQLTGWSTTAYEALHFGVPTILIHPHGLQAMQEYVKKGIFRYVENSIDLMEILKKPSFQEPPEVPYIEIEPDKIRRTFEAILGLGARN